MKNAQLFSEKLPVALAACALLLGVACSRAGGSTTETKDSVDVQDKPGEAEIPKPEADSSVTKVDEGAPVTTPMTARNYDSLRATFQAVFQQPIPESGTQRGQNKLADIVSDVTANLMTGRNATDFSGPAAFGLFSIAATACVDDATLAKLLGPNIKLTVAPSQGVMRNIATQLMDVIWGYNVTGGAPSDAEIGAALTLGDAILSEEADGAQGLTRKYAIAVCTAVASSFRLAFY